MRSLSLALSLTVLLLGMGCAGQNPKDKAAPDLPVSAKEYITNSIGMKLVKIPAGKFTMGSPDSEKDRRQDEGPQHEVEITKPFYMGVYEVTQEEYQAVMGTNPSKFENVAWQKTRRFPVEQVSWTEAVEFCRKLSELPDEKKAGRTHRLPTEAEWEYACRAGTKTVFHYGDSLSSSQANFNGAYPYGSGTNGPFLKRTTTVGSYPPNAFGLYDMHGNVMEWCADWYGDYTKETQKDPQGPQKGQDRVLRGGSWNTVGHIGRAAVRGNDSGYRSYVLGFRVVLAPGTP